LQYWRRRLGYGVPLVVVAILVLLAASPFKNKRVIYSKGPLSSAHAFIAKQCELCHSDIVNGERKVGLMQAASDGACLACHEAPVHHSQGKQPSPPSCSSCHMEHQGLVRLTHVQDQTCVTCHQNLDQWISDAKVEPRVEPKAARYIHEFNRDHPEFAAVTRRNKTVPGIVFHHAKHVGPTLETLKHQMVTLTCAECHRPVASANDAPWKYGQDGLASTASAPTAGQQLHPDAGREFMTMPTYEKNCAGCHDLLFDPRFAESVPHPRSNSREELLKVDSFVRQNFQSYVDRYPDAIRLPDPPAPGIPERRTLPLSANSQEWVAQRVFRAERFLWGESRCMKCHQLDLPAQPAEGAAPVAPGVLPVVQPSGFKPRQMPFSVFSHEAHTAVNCVSCHGGMPSVQDKPSALRRDVPDVSLPGIKSCQTCHNGDPVHAGKAENSCFLCHQYHKWNERTGPPTRYTFQQLRLPPVSVVEKSPKAN
jgi:hypothetical protein